MSKSIKEDINRFVVACYNQAVSQGWWTGVDIKNNIYIVPAKIALIHSEVSEALEGHRKDLMDDKLPHRKAIEVELADVIIRVADLAGALDLDIGGAIEEKMLYNLSRKDHKKEARNAKHGKKY